MVEETLLHAYRSAHYVVDLPAGQTVLRVDVHSPPLVAWLAAQQATSAALLTACNPGSVARSAAENQRRQQQLQHALQDAGCAVVAGRNRDPHGHWPDEASLLAAALPFAAARALAQQFGQLAFLWSDATAVPRLVWTADA